MSLTQRFERRIDTLSQKLNGISGDRILFGILILVSIAILSLFNGADVDLFTRVAVGRLTEILGTAPSQDPFVYMPVKPVWHDHEWLIGWVFYKVAINLDDFGLYLLRILFTIGTLAVMRAAQKCWKNSPLVGYALIFLGLPVILSIWHAIIRAQVVTYLCYAVFLLAFVQFRVYSKKGLLFALPALMPLWVNSHGGFVVGLGYSAIFAVVMAIERRGASWPALVSCVGCFAACLINPYGISFLQFIFSATTNLPTGIIEWFPQSLFTAYSICIAAMIIPIGIGIFRSPKVIPIEGYIMMALAGYEGFSHMRLLPLFVIALVIYGLPAFADGIEKLRTRFPVRVGALGRALLLFGITAPCISLGLIAFTILRDLSSGRLPFTLNYSTYPVAALEWLYQSQSGGNVLVHYNDGSYALWRLYPKFKISVDGRYDGVFEMKTIDTVLAAFNPTDPRQQEALATTNPDFILLHTDWAAYAERERMFPEYQVMSYMAQNDGFMVLARKSIPRALGGPQTIRPMWQPLF